MRPNSKCPNEIVSWAAFRVTWAARLRTMLEAVTEANMRVQGLLASCFTYRRAGRHRRRESPRALLQDVVPDVMISTWGTQHARRLRATRDGQTRFVQLH